MEPPQKITRGLPKFLREWLNSLLEFTVAIRPIKGFNTTVSESPNGTAINAQAEGNGVVAGKITPFQILSVPKDPSNPTLIKVGVAFYSGLTRPNFFPVTISGLLLSNQPLFDDTGAIAVSGASLLIGHKIWLRIDASNLAGPSASIQHGAVGGANWPDYATTPVELNVTDPAIPVQKYYHLLIAEVTNFETDLRPSILAFTVGSEHRQITQMYSKNVLLTLADVDRVTCLTPVDGALDYLKT